MLTQFDSLRQHSTTQTSFGEERKPIGICCRPSKINDLNIGQHPDNRQKNYSLVERVKNVKGENFEQIK